MDQNLPRFVFLISALFMVLTVVLAPFTERKRETEVAQAKAA